MALRTVVLIRDQNINVHYNGTIPKTSSSVFRKGGIGGRKLQNSVNQILIPTSNKNSKVLSFTEKETTVSKVTRGSSKTKSVSKASKKVQVGAWKALCDISNLGKPSLKETSKKSQTSKFTILAEIPVEPEDIAKEGCLHNHDECIKCQENTKSMNEFLKILGLEEFSNPPASAKGTHMPNEMPMSPSRYSEDEEMTELLIKYWSPAKLMIKDWSPPSPEPMDLPDTYELISSP
ncbi:RING/U-box superfamily protein, putative isoform 1 [Hibiscus syriacus]|uniref:RING/U-box superfamily protein, putative isoform 1 n=1 Tax=Hibiscus syriacus TaxID=106335 RepID=A0A6A2Z231_HIBSY|nr:RING/U-box superfamily protein, putative isoform 1 [Hibiscus syriacus]